MEDHQAAFRTRNTNQIFITNVRVSPVAIGFMFSEVPFQVFKDGRYTAEGALILFSIGQVHQPLHTQLIVSPRIAIPVYSLAVPVF